MVVTIVVHFAQTGTLTKTIGNKIAAPIMAVDRIFADGRITPWPCQSRTGGPSWG